jgi:hypothetical protein
MLSLLNKSKEIIINKYISALLYLIYTHKHIILEVETYFCVVFFFIICVVLEISFFLIHINLLSTTQQRKLNNFH